MKTINDYIDFKKVGSVFTDLMFFERTKDILSDSLFNYLKDYYNDIELDNNKLKELTKKVCFQFLVNEDIMFKNKEVLINDISDTAEECIYDYFDFKDIDSCLI